MVKTKRHVYIALIEVSTEYPECSDVATWLDCALREAMGPRDHPPDVSVYNSMLDLFQDLHDPASLRDDPLLRAVRRTCVLPKRLKKEAR